MPKERQLLDWLRADKADSAPLQTQIAAQLRDAIVDDRLAAGTLLPSSRVLAEQLGVSRGTITAAYEHLLADGVLQVRGRSATFVATRPAETEGSKATPADAGSDRQAVDYSNGDPPQHAAFLPGTSPVEMFPTGLWARLLSARCRQMTAEMTGEGTHLGGYLPLRTAIAAHLKSSRGVSLDPRQIIVTTSARAALATLCSLLTKRGDSCITEDPGYFIVGRVMRSLGLKTIPVPVDAGGLVVAPPLPRARLAYVTPTHQMPLGVTLAQDRREALLAWAARHDAWIVEDGYDSEFRYNGQPILPLQWNDKAGRVIFLGTFSKTLFPSLRVAFFVLPLHLVKEAERLVFLHGHEPMLHMQAALADFIGNGHYARHIRKVRSVYWRRLALLVGALNSHIEGMAPLPNPAGGMQLVLPLPPDAPALRVQEEAARHALYVRPISYYAEQWPAPNALHLGFAAIPDRQIEPAARRLADAIRQVRAEG